MTIKLNLIQSNHETFYDMQHNITLLYRHTNDCDLVLPTIRDWSILTHTRFDLNYKSLSDDQREGRKPEYISRKTLELIEGEQETMEKCAVC